MERKQMSNLDYLARDKEIASMSNEQLLEAIADDLVKMHIETGIDLAYWNVGLEIVRRYWYTSTHIEINGKMKND